MFVFAVEPHEAIANVAGTSPLLPSLTSLSETWCVEMSYEKRAPGCLGLYRGYIYIYDHISGQTIATSAEVTRLVSSN